VICYFFQSRGNPVYRPFVPLNYFIGITSIKKDFRLRNPPQLGNPNWVEPQLGRPNWGRCSEVPQSRFCAPPTRTVGRQTYVTFVIPTFLFSHCSLSRLHSTTNSHLIHCYREYERFTYSCKWVGRYTYLLRAQFLFSVQKQPHLRQKEMLTWRYWTFFQKGTLKFASRGEWWLIRIQIFNIVRI